MNALMALSVALAVVAIVVRLRARLLRSRVRSLGKVVYSDADTDGANRPLVSTHYGLIGKPDYVVARWASSVPVEIKSGDLPASGNPHRGHVLQLVAYCILVEEALGRRAPHGILRYRDGDVRVRNSWSLRRTVKRTAERIGRAGRDVPRSHRAPGRCRHCGFRDDCGQSLV